METCLKNKKTVEPNGNIFKKQKDGGTKWKHVYETRRRWNQMETCLESKEMVEPNGNMFRKQGDGGTKWKHV